MDLTSVPGVVRASNVYPVFGVYESTLWTAWNSISSLVCTASTGYLARSLVPLVQSPDADNIHSKLSLLQRQRIKSIRWPTTTWMQLAAGGVEGSGPTDRLAGWLARWSPQSINKSPNRSAAFLFAAGRPAGLQQMIVGIEILLQLR